MPTIEGIGSFLGMHAEKKPLRVLGLLTEMGWLLNGKEKGRSVTAFGKSFSGGPEPKGEVPG